jgi:uncharacterized protein YejL (UPF0352 family)
VILRPNGRNPDVLFNELELLVRRFAGLELGFDGSLGNVLTRFLTSNTSTPRLSQRIAISFANAMLTSLYAFSTTFATSAVSKSVPTEEVGATLGQSTSVDSVTRVLAPTLGGYLLGSVGIFAPGVFAALSTGWLILYGAFRLNLKRQPQLKAEAQMGFYQRGQVEASNG